MKLLKNVKFRRSLGLAAISGLTLATVATASPAQADSTPPTTGAKTPATITSKDNPVHSKTLKSGINPQDFNTAVKPSDDFFDYATGGWRAANPIPEDQARWGSFAILDDTNTKIIHEILQQASTNPQNALERKLGDFYQSGMDTTALKVEGITPLRKELYRIGHITDTQGICQMVSYLHAAGIDPYFGLFAGQDDKNSERMIAHLCQAGLGLPERDYYTRDDQKSKDIRAKYVKHMENIFRLAGDAPEVAAEEAQAVMALETKLAQASLPAADMRDPERIYHLMSLDELQKIAPDFPWKQYLQDMNLADVSEINVMMPEFMAEVNKQIFKDTPLADHIAYLRWNLLNDAAAFLSEDFEDEHFDFYSKTLRGITTQKPRWKRVASVINSKGAMGFALGEVYVQQHFSPEAKAKVEEIVGNITKVMERDIPTLTWMSPATQQEALKKLHSFKAKIGYPNVNRDYSKLEILDRGYYYNVRNCNSFEVARQLAQIGKPVDHNEWHMVPQMVNAYYSPSSNEIVFPAGILQPPFFDKDVDDAANYGGIGMVIGHEMSHGFDDQGSQYDGQGNLRNWWQEQDRQTFEKLAKGVEEQFSSYKINGTPMNGKLVLGESIADLSGLALSWRAYELSQQGKEPQTIDGFTPAQRFFLNYAKVWAINMRPEMEQLQVNTDPHPHARWRVNGPLSNMPVFFEAFNVPEGAPMRRPAEKQNKIW